MKCPHCGYIDGWDSVWLEVRKGQMGKFYKSPITLERPEEGDYLNQVFVFGCPECQKTFIEREYY